ncbi:hypothetical protein GCM10023191_023320 [Actinoallomurus oryzae]|uniref:30S ribosomal protein S14 n=1 Tax=Actinoallomurus oryzae TaxID=502180 RepID=A0ABP8PSN1_9ACTN
MAKKSKIVKNEQRRVVVARHAERRAELKRLIKAPDTDPRARAAAVRELSRQPRDASPIRLRNRDAVDGRPPGDFAQVRALPHPVPRARPPRPAPRRP